jgi:hypothetical protein
VIFNNATTISNVEKIKNTTFLKSKRRQLMTEGLLADPPTGRIATA